MPGIDECLCEAMAIPGVRGAGLVDWTSGLALGAAGAVAERAGEAAAARTADMARLAFESGPLGEAEPGGDPVEDIIVTARDSYQLLRFLETEFDSSLFLCLWMDRAEANLAVARLRLRELADRLVLA
ncbi:hypothetical protein [Streptomyces sp. URMC 123]|uniref:hypothetical protein n=1 Tax=Streptomyces sp. URMC 123 TaxID=3423403 RepID=UPI003F1D8722